MSIESLENLQSSNSSTEDLTYYRITVIKPVGPHDHNIPEGYRLIAVNPHNLNNDSYFPNTLFISEHHHGFNPNEVTTCRDLILQRARRLSPGQKKTYYLTEHERNT